jgi:hypothetical protein
VEEFRDRYERPSRPVILKGTMNQWKALTQWQHPQFITKYGDTVLKVKKERKKENEGTYSTNYCFKIYRQMALELMDIVFVKPTKNIFATVNTIMMRSRSMFSTIRFINVPLNYSRNSQYLLILLKICLII